MHLMWVSGQCNVYVVSESVPGGFHICTGRAMYCDCWATNTLQACEKQTTSAFGTHNSWSPSFILSISHPYSQIQQLNIIVSCIRERFMSDNIYADLHQYRHCSRCHQPTQICAHKLQLWHATVCSRVQGKEVLPLLYCSKKVLTSRISGPDKYRQVVLGVRRGVYSSMVNCCEDYGAFLDQWR